MRVMDYRSLFDDVMYEKYDSTALSDDEEFIRIVKERAENMKNKNENVERGKLIEITPEHYTPKKSRRIFNAVAGTAAAVAVVGGSAWGINFLKENGGLKQRDPGTTVNAGYHEEVPDPAESEPPKKEETVGYTDSLYDLYQKVSSIEYSPLFTSADEWFDCDGKRVHVTGYAFDGIILQLRYETCYDYPIDDKGNDYALEYELPDCTSFLCSGDIDYTRKDEGIVESTYNIYASVLSEKIDIPFGDSIFTAYRNNSVPMSEKEIGRDIPVSGDDTVHLDRLVLTPGNLSISMSQISYHKPYPNSYKIEQSYAEALWALRLVITLADGSVLESGDTSTESDDWDWTQPAGMGLPDGLGYKFYQFKDQIDINDVVSITVNGVEIFAVD